MITRTLGRTGLEVGAIGLGTEHLIKSDREVILSVIRAAIAGGMNYFDLLMPQPDYRDLLGEAFRPYITGERERLVLVGHLGCSSERGVYQVTRDPARAEEGYADLLRRLGTDYMDIAMICVVDTRSEFKKKIMNPGGLYDVAVRLREKGMARFIGLSGHTEEIGHAVASSGGFDVHMQPVNMFQPNREVVGACARAGTAVVAMKPFRGGELLHPPFSAFIKPVTALSFVLDQPGVSCVVPGVRALEELESVLAYLTAGEDDLRYASILERLPELVPGTCVYCDHCLPCEAEIPISEILGALQMFERGESFGATLYGMHRGKALACTGCGECEKRCPFGVSVAKRLGEAVRLFEGAAEGGGGTEDAGGEGATALGGRR